LFTTEGSTPNVELTSLAPVIISGTRYLIAASKEKLYSITSAGVVNEIGKGFTSGKWCVIQAPKSTEVAAEGPVYLTNGKDKTQYWTGTEAKTEVKEWTGIKTENKVKEATYLKAPYVPQGKFMIFAFGRVWMANLVEEPSTVWFSESVSAGEGGGEPDPSNWPKLNNIRFDPEDSKPITGIGTVGAYVLVFKESKVWVIHGTGTGQSPVGAVRKLADKVGCVAQRSIVETTGGTFFLSADQGVQLTNGSTIKEMSYSVRPTILNINPANRENAAAEYWNNHYYLSYPSGVSTTNNRTLDYDAELKSWWLHDLAGNQWARFEANVGEPSLFTIPARVKAGIVQAFVEGIYTDSGANYVGNGTLGAFWISPWEPFAYYIFRHRIKAPFLKKRVRQIFFNGEGQIIPSVYKNFNVGERQEPAVVANKEIATEDKLPVNFSEGAGLFGEGPGLFGSEAEGGEVLFGGESTVGSARIYAPGIANVWSVGWGNNSAEPFVVHAFTYMVQFRKS
jgi:hypothetical protein